MIAAESERSDSVFLAGFVQLSQAAPASEREQATSLEVLLRKLKVKANETFFSSMQRALRNRL